MMTKLNLPSDKIERARELASAITKPVQEYIRRNTTETVERATLRLLGTDLATEEGIPTANIIVQQLHKTIADGAARYYVNALIKKGCNPDALNREIVLGLDISKMELVDFKHIKAKAKELIGALHKKVSGNVEFRAEKINAYRDNANTPLLYVIVATGNIYEDVKQAQAAAIQGADIVAVIRSTAQSLLDYVPYGATTEGFGGTYATQENFRIMRHALDEIGEKEKKYVRLVNYCSGLCMPEIAAMGAIERLDMMLNDSMYGVLFRDINMYRTFVDQNFSRMINSYADIVINTGEDNYLTTSDAYEKAYTVVASQLINENFAKNAGMPSRLMGLGHAFEINPKMKNGFLFELGHALLVREIFPDCPLKYMPPTKYMTGDIFTGYVMNAMFNIVAGATKQDILLLGMLTEAIHTPFMQDRYLAIKNAKYIINNIADLHDDLEYKTDGIVTGRANEVLDQTIDFLEKVSNTGLFNAIENGSFADIKRPKTGGKGFDGVYEKSPDYWNPAEEHLKNELGIEE